MDDRITQEQAVEIAEWLGVKSEKCEFGDSGIRGDGKQDTIFYEEIGRYTNEVSPHIVTPDRFLREYLYSPKGQSAVMDRLGEAQWFTCKYYSVQRDWEVTIQFPLSREYGHAKTRQHALLLAVLELLKKV
jgi:hypothetical protein